MAGVGGMLNDKAKAGMEGKGMVVTACETIMQAMDKVGQMSKLMAPFMARSQAIVKAGLEQMAGEKGGIQTEQPEPGAPAGSNGPGGAGPGGGFPG